MDGTVSMSRDAMESTFRASLRAAQNDHHDSHKDREQAEASLESIRVLTVNELLATKIPARRFLLDDIIRERDLVMVFSWRGIGKTYFALNTAYAIASGGEYLRWKADSPRKVLYVD